MTQYKKFIFPLIAAGLMIAHVPVQAMNTELITKNTVNLCQPWFNAVLKHSGKFYKTAVQENPVTTVAFTVGGLGLAASGWTIYNSIYTLRTKNAELAGLRGIINQEKEKYKELKEASNFFAADVAKKVSELNNEVQGANKANQRLLGYMSKFKNEFACSFGTWLCNRMGEKEAFKFDDKDLTDDTCNVLNETKGKALDVMTLVAQNLANKGVQERTEYIENDNKGLVVHITNKRERGKQREFEIVRLNKVIENKDGKIKQLEMKIAGMQNKEIDTLPKTDPTKNKNVVNKVGAAVPSSNPMLDSKEFTELDPQYPFKQGVNQIVDFGNNDEKDQELSLTKKK